MKIGNFQTVVDKGLNFRQVFQIYDSQFETLRDFILTLGDKYVVEEIVSGTSSEVILQNKYASGQLFLYVNNVLQWKDRDYEEVSPSVIRLLFERTADDEIRAIIIRSNVMQAAMELYLEKINLMYQESKDAYNKAELIRATLNEFYETLEQKRRLYTQDDVEAAVGICLEARGDANDALASARSLESHIVWNEL